MSAAVAFDTLKFVEKLEAAGVSHAQAKATAEAFAEATSQELATKAADLALIRADLGLAKARLETKIESTKAEIIKWLFGTIGFADARHSRGRHGARQARASSDRWDGHRSHSAFASKQSWTIEFAHRKRPERLSDLDLGRQIALYGASQ